MTWTKKDIQFLVKNCISLSDQEIAEKLKKSPKAVRDKRQVVTGVRHQRGRPKNIVKRKDWRRINRAGKSRQKVDKTGWVGWQIDLLFAMYEEVTVEEIVIEIGKPEREVKNKVKYLHLGPMKWSRKWER